MGLGDFLDGKVINGIHVKCWITLNSFNRQFSKNSIPLELIIEYLELYIKSCKGVIKVNTFEFADVYEYPIQRNGLPSSFWHIELRVNILMGDKKKTYPRNLLYTIKMDMPTIKMFLRDKRLDNILS